MIDPPSHGAATPEPDAGAPEPGLAAPTPEPDAGAPEPGLAAPTPEPDAGAPEPGLAAPTPGLLTFTIDGRRAPALFLIGWLATILGAAITLVGVLASGGVAGAIVFTAGLGLFAIGLVAAAGSQVVERTAAGWRPYAGPSPVLLLVAAVPATVFLIVVVGTPLVGLGMDPSGPPALLISTVLTAAVYVGLLRLIIVGPGVLAWRDLGVVAPSRTALADLAWGAALAVPVLTVSGLLAVGLSGVLPVPSSPLPLGIGGIGLVLNLVTAGLVAPIGEELFFRGFVTTAWARLRGRRDAIVRGAVLFAIAHVVTVGGSSAGEGLGLAAFAFATRLPVALVLGWLFLGRRSLWAPIGLHAAFNAIQVLVVASAS